MVSLNDRARDPNETLESSCVCPPLYLSLDSWSDLCRPRLPSFSVCWRLLLWSLDRDSDVICCCDDVLLCMSVTDSALVPDEVCTIITKEGYTQQKISSGELRCLHLPCRIKDLNRDMTLAVTIGGTTQNGNFGGGCS